MKTSAAGKAHMKRHEGLVLKVYLDPVGIKTAGLGHTGPDVDALEVGTKITKAQAEKWFNEDVRDAERVVDGAVTTELTQGQYDALVSFVLNVGPGRKGAKDGFVTLKSGKPSTMLTKINARQFDAAAAEFPKWASAKGKKLPGLVRRRAEEQAMFLSGLQHEEQELESNVEADCERKPKSMLRQPGAQATAAVTTAAVLNEQASKFESVAFLSDYALYIFITLTVLALLYTLKAKKEDDE